MPATMLETQSPSASQLLSEYFRISDPSAGFVLSGKLSKNSGYFRFGPDIICYGQCSSGTPSKAITASLHDARPHVSANEAHVQLPFDPTQILDNLRCERYLSPQNTLALTGRKAAKSLYYAARPLMPVAVRKHLQKAYLSGWEKVPFPKWPVDRSVEKILEQLLVLSMKARNLTKIPFIWFWPNGAPSCAIVTHDVETAAGRDYCSQLMDLNDSFGIKAAFQIVPEGRYSVPPALLSTIRERGFEINVHDLNHDGNLTKNREQFLRRANQINSHAREFGARGFRSAVLNRNTDWYGALDFSYDMSIPNVAHLDPQRGGCCTVLPFFIGNMVELPVTMTQDYSLFHILNDYSTRLWKEQISLIREKHGLISVIVHPDYVIAEKARCVYIDLLRYLCELRAEGETWIALPNEVADWWRLRSELKLVGGEKSWRIEGKGSERARVAYAVLQGDEIRYERNA